MEERIIGQVRRVNGPVIEAQGVTDAIMLELVRVGEIRLVGEIIKLAGDSAIVQVYEDTTGVAPGENIYGSGSPLSVELGPGLIGTIYDGIQRPLEAIGAISGSFIRRGIQVPSLDREKRWHFVPASLEPGAEIAGGTVLGTVQETERVQVKILAPPGAQGVLKSLAPEGEYAVEETVALLQTAEGEHPLALMHRWPIRRPRPVRERLPVRTPLITGQRVIDTLFPVARGGTVAIPGGFGTGKTMTQHAIAKWCDAEIIVYIGCGERGNEMTDVLTEFPKLIDPRTGRSLMERTVLIANTSNMPVSAREASIYTGVTLAEYFRDQGYDVAVMADSTSRWAEALRELSGRMEEMPAEEGFPAYLPTRIAEFYERAGSMRTLSGDSGSVSIIGAVSPPGGDFSEPVTQHTKRFVRCFWALDRQLANARHYPAIGWLESYSEYLEEVIPWWEQEVGPTWAQDRAEIMELLQREVRLQQVVKLVGPDALPDSQRFVIEVCTLFKNAFLQQNAFDEVDRYSTAAKQMKMLQIILTYWRRGSEAIRRGTTLVRVRRMKVLQDIVKMKFTVPNEKPEALDKLAARLERSLDQLEAVYEEGE
ncbi:MAG: V-type ATP synthase subunit A [Spirochaetales bacterium]|nr:V-type ATP synthase subunit A [Spirochaetales bacterium]